ncbi:hypothetical protein FCM35_KLT05960 [Carex littledalei]|uniref:Uncharacterized protein n=1 Tax=Carex littledalei TaxID=544730 RepID=A0A833QXP3_9POAL|nr:hypothetical protein FCM35_KLT05960 [Carex littledalei]
MALDPLRGIGAMARTQDIQVRSMQVNEAKRVIISDYKVHVDAVRRNCIEDLPSSSGTEGVTMRKAVPGHKEQNHPIPMLRNKEGSPAGAHTGKFGETNRPIL